MYVNDTGGTDTSYTDTNVTESVRHVYRVKAINPAGLSEWSNYDRATPQGGQSQEQPASNNPATGAPVISGAARVGETLTADTGGIADEDGTENAVYSYQWLADDAAISGATGSAYTLDDADQGKTIRVRVSFTDDGGHDETLTSAPTSEIAARPNSPATGEPTISGAPLVGETLTADIGGIDDEDGLTNATYAYQWLANDGEGDSDIGGATDSTYTLTAADQGKTIEVRVSFTDDRGHEETLTSAPTGAVAGLPPLPLTASFQAGTVPANHGGAGQIFTVRVEFSEAVAVSYKTLRDQALEVTNGTARKFRRVDGSSELWEIHVEPDSGAAVTLLLAATTDCEAAAAICTAEGQPLSQGIELTVPGS